MAGKQIELGPDIECSFLAISAFFMVWSITAAQLSLRRPMWAVNLWVSVKCSDSECGLGMEVEI